MRLEMLLGEKNRRGEVKMGRGGAGLGSSPEASWFWVVLVLRCWVVLVEGTSHQNSWWRKL